MKSTLVRLALLLPFVAATAAAQDFDRLAKLDPASRYTVEKLLDSARVVGLPDRALLSVVYEGIGKGAPSRKIVQAVDHKLRALLDARDALGNANEAELSAAADVLQAGVPLEQLRKFHAPKGGGRPVLVALVVLGDLVTRGVPMEEASSTIAQLWQKGAGADDLYGLWHGVEQDILQGQSPGTALQQRAREFPGRTPSGKLPPNTRPETPSS